MFFVLEKVNACTRPSANLPTTYVGTKRGNFLRGVCWSVHEDRGDQRGGMHTNERLHVKLITIGPYGRRKRSDLNPSTSVRCEGIGKKFFLHFLKRMKPFM